MLFKLLSIAKLQNLKAIHNTPTSKALKPLVVINRKVTKFESNSQQPLQVYPNLRVVINHKTTKIESNSQRLY